jgi:hypothetical protein
MAAGAEDANDPEPEFDASLQNTNPVYTAPWANERGLTTAVHLETLSPGHRDRLYAALCVLVDFAGARFPDAAPEGTL